MNELEERTVARLCDKSQEAFILALEVYNRPSIRYRVEGFAFFICNAWELMLKAKLIRDRGMASIYYPDNPSRTKTLEKCMDLVLTNDKDPLKRNLKDIVRLRNTSTHFIVEEHEQLYVGLFQACVFNYDDKMHDWHGINVSDSVPAHFLTLSMTPSPVSVETIRAKYAPEIAERFLFDEATVRGEEDELANQRYSVVLRTELAVVRNPKHADFTVAVNPDSDRAMRMAKVFRDPHNTHPLSVKMVVEHVRKSLSKKGVTLMAGGSEKQFTTNDWSLFVRFYDIKSNPDYAYEHRIGKSSQYTYSMAVVDMIVSRISENPSGIIDDLKGLEKSVKEADPRGKGF